MRQGGWQRPEGRAEDKQGRAGKGRGVEDPQGRAGQGRAGAWLNPQIGWVDGSLVAVDWCQQGGS